MSTAIIITVQTLLQDTVLHDKVGTRIFSVSLPQQSSPPCVVVSLVGEREEDLLAGASRYPESRLSVECMALSPSDADLIGELVKDALRDKHEHPIKGCLATFRKADSDVTDGSDEQGVTGLRQVSRRTLDFYCRWRKA